MMKQRLEKLRGFLQHNNLDAIIVSKPENRHYFSGFTGGDGILVITLQTADLITDFRYVEQAGKEVSCFTIVEHGRSLMEAVATVLKSNAISCIGFEGDDFTYNDFTLLKMRLNGENVKAVGLDQLREVKDDREIALVRKAVEISDRAFSHILTILRPGITERMVAAELEHVMRNLGSERPAFATIVASGVRSSLPHGLATDKLLEIGDFVTMDFGAVYQGYHSDITRTVCIGKASAEQRKIYDIVLEAQLLGVNSVRPGEAGRKIDEIARKLIMRYGYGKYFGHGLGHGVGLAIHELPRLSPSSQTEALTANMLVTVEPGIYVPGFGGVRIEDTVLVTADGAEVLTKSSKQLIEIE